MKDILDVLDYHGWTLEDLIDAVDKDISFVKLEPCRKFPTGCYAAQINRPMNALTELTHHSRTREQCVFEYFVNHLQRMTAEDVENVICRDDR